jgi:hypothetical protein
MRRLALLALLIAGCQFQVDGIQPVTGSDSPSLPADNTPTPSSTPAPSPTPAPDLAVAPDLASAPSAPDLAVAPDLSSSADFSAPPDLAKQDHGGGPDNPR